jgi:spoIIIJ-associated protein
MDQEVDKNAIQRIVLDFFSKMGFLADVFIEKKEEKISIKIQTEDPKVLIGQSGQTLSEIQHLLRIVIKRAIQGEFYLDVDINEYKEKKKEYLEETARLLADEVSLTKEERALPSMSPFDRRIIHTFLSNRSDVKTESDGEGIERRVVIKPA